MRSREKRLYPNNPGNVEHTLVNALLLLALTAGYAITLEWCYAHLISPKFDYLGMHYAHPNQSARALSIALSTLVLLALPRSLKSPSDFILWTFVLIAALPSIFMSQYVALFSAEKGVRVALIYTASTIIIAAIYKLIPRLTFRTPVQSHTLQLAALIFSTAFYLILFTVGGGSFKFASLDAVQDVREGYKIVAAGLPGFGYMVQIQASVINPLILTVAVSRRRWWLAGLTTAGQMTIYSATGYKIVALSPIFIILLYLAVHFRKTSGRTLAAGVLASMFSALLLDAFNNAGFFVNIFINRLLANPGLLTSAYFYVFDGQEKYRWSNSFLSGITSAGYSKNAAYVVGSSYQHSAKTQANVNLIGDGYANWGLWGVAIEAIFLGLVLGVLAACARHVPLEVSVPACTVAALGLTNTSSFTSVLTGGLGGLAIVFALWPRSMGAGTVVSSTEFYGVNRQRKKITHKVAGHRARQTPENGASSDRASRD